MDKAVPNVVAVPVRTSVESVSERVRLLAHRAGAGARLPGVTALCRELQISPNTLNKALGALQSEGVVERRNGVGVFVGSELPALTQRVVFLCDPTFFRAANRSPFWDFLLEFGRERAQSGGESFECHFALSGAQPVHPYLLADARAGRVHGVISVGLLDEAAQWVEACLAPHVPVVSLAQKGRWIVAMDEARFVQLGAQVLAGRGCKRPGFWRALATRRAYSLQEDEFQQSYRRNWSEALRAHGLDFEPQLYRNNRHLLRFDGDETTLTGKEQGFALAREVFGAPRDTWPDGLVINDDMMTRGALAALAALGVRPGRDVAIVSHANTGSDVLLGHEDELTRIEYDPIELVDRIFAVLEPLMAGGTPNAIAFVRSQDDQFTQFTTSVLPHLRA